MKLATHLIALIAILLTAGFALPQTPSSEFRGQVTDPSGAAITNATVVMTPVTGSPVSTQTNAQGMFEFQKLAPGKYTLTVVATGFTLYENDNIEIADQPLRLNVQLTIEVPEQKVQVSDTAPTIDVNPSSNAGAIVISGKELEALPDDPDELQADLEALAGPSAGPNGGQMYIDGFTAGQLPPKSSICEIRINQNPFSSEYDKLGYGRIEIFTQPGTDQWHGDADAMGNDSALNTRSPFLGNAEQPGYYSDMVGANIGGPLAKNASFFFDVQRRSINDLSIINAAAPPDYTLGDFTQGIPNYRTRLNIGPRVDYQLGKNDTLTFRYQYWRNNEQNQGIGAFTLPTQAYNTLETEQTVQAGETHIIGANIVNET